LDETNLLDLFALQRGMIAGRTNQLVSILVLFSRMIVNDGLLFTHIDLLPFAVMVQALLFPIDRC
jgi:hypothetical protein